MSPERSWSIKSKNAVIAGVVFIVLVSLMFLVESTHQSDSNNAASSAQGEIAYWTCSMHPQIKLPSPGACPICGMDLIPLKTDGGDDERTLSMSLAAQKLAKIETSLVERKFVSSNVRVTGKIAYDETRVSYITSWVSGRIDRLYVDYTGVAVSKGDHMALIYSPDLLSAQEEYLQAIKGVSDVGGSHLEVMRETSQNTLDNAREKLKLLGITADQIQKLEQTQVVQEQMTIYSPMSGVVLSKEEKEGAYVKTGSRLYSVADLSKLWVVFNVYESDLPWIHFGQTVSFETEAYPGETFEGTVSFISPVVDEQTRTIQVRVNVDNAKFRLKPGMFVRGQISGMVTEEGDLVNDRLAGKWISPMHPEIIKDAPGSCDVCGMDLVSAESLGYISSAKVPPLLIPDTAPLITGKRAIVYVAVPNVDKPTYEGRDIVLGSKLGSYYVVHSGLEEGERVVTRGNFKIDSAIQLKSGVSMMNPAKEELSSQKESMIVVPLSFLNQLTMIYRAYFAIQEGLAHDDWASVRSSAEQLLVHQEHISVESLDDDARKEWLSFKQELLKILAHLDHVQGVEDFRSGLFLPLSQLLVALEQTFGHVGEDRYYQVSCPMALNNQGAFWLQAYKDVANPYFGSAMLSCGEVAQEFSPRHGDDATSPAMAVETKSL